VWTRFSPWWMRGRANDRFAGLTDVLQPLRVPSGPGTGRDTSGADVGRGFSGSTSDRVHPRRRGAVPVRVSVLVLVASSGAPLNLPRWDRRRAPPGSIRRTESGS